MTGTQDELSLVDRPSWAMLQGWLAARMHIDPMQ
jgi:hypothetical protein